MLFSRPMRPFLSSAIVSGLAMLWQWVYFQYILEIETKSALINGVFQLMERLEIKNEQLLIFFIRQGYYVHWSLLSIFIPAISFSLALKSKGKQRGVLVFWLVSMVATLLMFGVFYYIDMVYNFYHYSKPFANHSWLILLIGCVGYFWVNNFSGLLKGKLILKKPKRDFFFSIIPAFLFFIGTGIYQILDQTWFDFFPDFEVNWWKLQFLRVIFFDSPVQFLWLGGIVTFWQIFVGKMIAKREMAPSNKIDEIGRNG